MASSIPDEQLVTISALHAELLAARAEIARLRAENALLRHNQLTREAAVTANRNGSAIRTGTVEGGKEPAMASAGSGDAIDAMFHSDGLQQYHPASAAPSSWASGEPQTDQGRIRRLCSVPDCTKQSDGRRSDYMCRRHYTSSQNSSTITDVVEVVAPIGPPSAQHDMPASNTKKEKHSRTTSKRKRKSRSGRDPSGPKHVPGPYIFFTNDMRPQIMKESPDIKFAELGKLMGERWRALGSEGRKRYEDMAARDKIRYEREVSEWNAKSATATSGEELLETDSEQEKPVLAVSGEDISYGSEQVKPSNVDVNVSVKVTREQVKPPMVHGFKAAMSEQGKPPKQVAHGFQLGASDGSSEHLEAAHAVLSLRLGKKEAFRSKGDCVGPSHYDKTEDDERIVPSLSLSPKRKQSIESLTEDEKIADPPAEAKETVEQLLSLSPKKEPSIESVVEEKKGTDSPTDVKEVTAVQFPSRSPRKKRPNDSSTEERKNDAPTETKEISINSLWFSKRNIVKPKQTKVGEMEGRGAEYTNIFIQQTLLELLRKVGSKVDKYGYFARPVDPIEDECPDYYDIIDKEKEAMDLDTMESMIKSGSIACIDEFETMLNRIAHCCRKYNSDPENGVREEGDKIDPLSKPLLENARNIIAKRLECNTEKSPSVSTPTGTSQRPAKRIKTTSGDSSTSRKHPRSNVQSGHREGTEMEKGKRKGKKGGRQSGPIVLYDRPAPDIGRGWRVKGVKRKRGQHSDHVDRYWFSPKEMKKLRSKREVEKFLNALEVVQGDENKAYAMIQRK
eukprot:CAMPEP_0178692774 /NCGR_PEP_ID=MMETSP0699-20121125/7367_1 /TAXON_ID=265572 /ORGANISM="Extubocellulus spinifer, Strain CCMP396" /LENGTH=789 /DNA_ID=CAMNT_0020338159 /DNA_START=569 /DNA_END=2938 /DNA_ORIENTATION=-